MLLNIKIILKATIPYLQEYVNYSISVRAYTSVGPGIGSEAIIELTLQAGKWILALLF